MQLQASQASFPLQGVEGGVSMLQEATATPGKEVPCLAPPLFSHLHDLEQLLDP